MDEPKDAVPRDPETTPTRGRYVYGLALSAAIVYGLSARFFFGLGSAHAPTLFGTVFKVMSVAFIFGVPFVIGFLSTYLSRETSLLRALFVPLAPSLASLALALLFAWEGLICIFLWLPLFVVLSMSGGLAAFLVLRFAGKRQQRLALGTILILPYGASFPEAKFGGAAQVRVVETTVLIRAPRSVVWGQIVQVPPIRPEEHSFSWSHAIGFPRPIAAEVRGAGVGSIRLASFERGVVFVETVTASEPEKLLSFTIAADPASIPAKALDEHVTVGGPYFDVLSGTYRLEERDGGTLLYLSSEHRLSTHFDSYSSLWTDFIMRDTQKYILEIVAKRAERSSRNKP